MTSLVCRSTRVLKLPSPNSPSDAVLIALPPLDTCGRLAFSYLCSCISYQLHALQLSRESSNQHIFLRKPIHVMADVLLDRNAALYFGYALISLLFRPRLSSELGEPACLPNGDFILPGTPGQPNIWDRSLFFTITLPFGRSSSWSYTIVRVIDLIWDIGIGRGCQIILVWLAYRVFHRAITAIMQSEPVSYAAYSTVAFRSGSSLSVPTMFHACSKLKSSWRSIRTYLLIAVTTIYIVCMPSLFSAMTGYAATYSPAMLVPFNPGGFSGNASCGAGGCQQVPCGVKDLGRGLRPGWGVVRDSWRYECWQPDCNTTDPWNINQDLVPSDGVGWKLYQAYYDKYKDRYDSATQDRRCTNLTTGRVFADCPPLELSSQFNGVNLSAPLLNMNPWGSNTSTGMPNYWLCDTLILSTASITSGTNVTGTCTANASYQWGFSFLILFIVCILDFAFALLMYSLWVVARRQKPRTLHRDTEAGDEVASIDLSEPPSLLRDVMVIASNAENRYGEEVKGWSTAKLEQRIWKGRDGLQAKLNHD